MSHALPHRGTLWHSGQGSRSWHKREGTCIFLRARFLFRQPRHSPLTWSSGFWALRFAEFLSTVSLANFGLGIKKRRNMSLPTATVLKASSNEDRAKQREKTSRSASWSASSASSAPAVLQNAPPCPHSHMMAQLHTSTQYKQCACAGGRVSHKQASMLMSPHTHTHPRTHARTHASRHARTHADADADADADAHARARARARARAHARTRAHAHTHTHTHTLGMPRRQSNTKRSNT